MSDREIELIKEQLEIIKLLADERQDTKKQNYKIAICKIICVAVVAVALIISVFFCDNNINVTNKSIAENKNSNEVQK